MRPLILLAVILAVAPVICAAPSPATQAVLADWRRDGVDDRVKAALTGLGWRLEDDGRALDPTTKAPVTKDALDKAMFDLRQGARRAALEAVNLILSSGGPMDRRKVEVLSADLPPALAAAIDDPVSDMIQVKAMAAADLARVAAYFDGGRTLADRQAAAQPVTAGTPDSRVDLPYFTAAERSVGEKLRASAEAEIGRDLFGKTFLARLNGKNGKPELPPIVIEDQYGEVAAQYDFRRRTIALDREEVLSFIIAAAPPRLASSLRASLSTRAALISYLDTHPEAVSAVVKGNDVVLVHELTHAGQDRRDPIFREIARGNLPDAQPLEYEEEAYKIKNMYLHSKLRNDPAAVTLDREFSDYILMTHGRESWKQALFKDLNDASPSRTLPLTSIQDVQAGRVAQTRGRAVLTPDEQRAKALDLKALSRGQRELAALKTAHESHMAAIDAAIDAAGLERSKLLGRYYLLQADLVKRSIDRDALLAQAQRYAKTSGNAALIERVRRAKGKKQ